MLPLSIFALPRKLLVALIVGGVSVMLAGVFLYEVYAQPLPQSHSASAAAAPSGTVYLSPAAQAAAVASSTKPAPILEVHIANSGLMLLRGARVLSVSGSTIHVGMTWDSNTFTWALDTNYNTQFLNIKGEKGALGDIQAGDTLIVTGTLTTAGSEPSIDTKTVREE